MSTANPTKHITHEGTVLEVFPGSVDVSVVTNSACGACKMKKACGMDESDEKVITVFTEQAERYKAGETVEVTMKQAMGYKALAIVYLIPILVIMTALALLIQCGMEEITAGCITLGFLGLYYFAVYLFRGKIEQEIRFDIKKSANNQS